MATLLSQMRALPSAAKLLLFSNGISAVGVGMVLPFLWVYLTEIRHFDTWVPAAALAVQAAAAVAGGLFYGALTDRLPYNRVVPLANVHAGIGTMIYAFAGSPWVALLAATVFGFGVSGVSTSVRAAYAAATEKSQRETVYSADYGVMNVMMGLGIVVGGLLAAASVSTAVVRYGVLYGLDALTFFFMAVMTIRGLPSGAREKEEEKKSGGKVGYGAVLRQTDLLKVLLILLFTSLVTIGQFRAGLPGYLIQSGAVSSSGLSFSFTLNIVVCALVQFWGMSRLTGFRRKHLVAASGVLAAACWVLIYLAGHNNGVTALAIACVGVILFSVSEALIGPLLSTLLNNRVAERNRGRANALFSITLSTSSVIGPVTAGVLLPLGGGVGLIISMVALSVLATAVAFALPGSAEETADSDEGDAEADKSSVPAAG
jgi:MFS family permease